MVSENLDRSLENTAKKPQVARETKYYMEHIGDVKSIDDFFADDRLYRFAMKASGLEDMTYAKAFMRKVLKEGLDSAKSFANSLSDQRYRQFAATFDFVKYGDTATSRDVAKQGTVDKYLRQTLEEDTGAQSEGARLALYFERKAGDIKSIFNILADKALLKVVQTAFAIPESSSMMDIDKQAEMLKKRLDVADLQDPEKLKKFLTRFTSLWEIDNGATSSASANTAMVFGQSAGLGISSNVLSAIQNLKLGGR